MYADFYNLKKEAFHITPDPEFLFLSPSHKEALASIVYGVQRRKGFVLITGEVGVGKTTIIRSYLEKVDREKLKVIYIFNANVSFQGLLKTIYQELGIVARSENDFELVNQLHEVLIEEYKNGYTVVLIIDEAQNMPVNTLENLRMLSNLETSVDKLIQIVFSGQPEFEKKLERKELRQLKQRIAVRTTIKPLTFNGSLEYIRHRLDKVSTSKTSIFTDGALKRIVKEACGIPRVINILCENALITALGHNKKQVDSRIAEEVIADFTRKKTRTGLRLAAGSALLVLVIICTFLVYFYKDVWIVMLGVQPSVTVGSRNNPGMAGKVKDSPVPSIEATGVAPNRADLVNTTNNPVKAGPTSDSTAKGEPGNGIDNTRQSRAGDEFPVVKTVRQGDTLSGLVMEVYGYNSKELILFVKKNNSSINNVNRIMIGQQVVFPARDKRGGRTYE